MECVSFGLSIYKFAVGLLQRKSISHKYGPLKRFQLRIYLSQPRLSKVAQCTTKLDPDQTWDCKNKRNKIKNLELEEWTKWLKIVKDFLGIENI